MKKLLLFLFLIILVVCSCSDKINEEQNSPEVEESDRFDVWDGFSVDMESISNQLHAGNTVVISTAAELAAMRDMINNDERGFTFSSVTFRLERDLDMTIKDWEPIYGDPTNDTYFKGIFDGNGHTIKIKSTGGDYTSSGLFRYIEGVAQSDFTEAEPVIIKNLTVDAEINNAGLFANVGCLVGKIGHDAVIENCSTTTSSVISGSGLDSCGGIVGTAGVNVIIKDCTNNASIISVDDSGYFLAANGGIIGSVYFGDENEFNDYTIISGCVNNGSITGLQPTGGIIGGTYPGNGIIMIRQCKNTADITSDTYAGGIAGKTFNRTFLYDCGGGRGNIFVTDYRHNGGRLIGSTSFTSLYDSIHTCFCVLAIDNSLNDDYSNIETIGVGYGDILLKKGTYYGSSGYGEELNTGYRLHLEQGTSWIGVDVPPDAAGNVYGVSSQLSPVWKMCPLTGATEWEGISDAEKEYLINTF